YVMADRELFAFVVTTDGARPAVVARAIPIVAAQLAGRIERFRDRIGKRDFAGAGDAPALYDTLLAPPHPALAGKSRITVVPDGALWNVPFQALRSPTGYVIESAAVSYAPSITALREILNLRRPDRTRTLLAIGKTEFGADARALPTLPEAEAQVRVIRDLY